MFTELDDDLFPACHADTVGLTHTDEYGVTYICDLLEGLGYGWIQLGKPDRP